MGKTNLTDDEFVATWMRYQGRAGVMAKALGVSERNIYSRRTSIENRRGLVLPSSPTGQFTSRPREFVEKIGHRITLTAKDGQAVVFSDAHYWPGDKPVAHAALIRFIKASKPQIIICNGDAFDGARISRHPPAGYTKMPEVAEELKYCQQMIGEIIEAAPAKAKLCWNMGNHDTRFSARLAQMAPEYVGVHGVDLPDHFPEWNFAWSTFINDDVVVKHRLRNGVHATWNNTLHSGKSIVTGHLHRLAMTPITDYNGRRYGVDCGTLSDFGPDTPKFTYAEDNPFNWASGFCVLTWKNEMLLPPELVTVLNGVPYFRGAPL